MVWVGHSDTRAPAMRSCSTYGLFTQSSCKQQSRAGSTRSRDHIVLHSQISAFVARPLLTDLPGSSREWRGAADFVVVGRAGDAARRAHARDERLRYACAVATRVIHQTSRIIVVIMMMQLANVSRVNCHVQRVSVGIDRRASLAARRCSRTSTRTSPQARTARCNTCTTCAPR